MWLQIAKPVTISVLALDVLSLTGKAEPLGAHTDGLSAVSSWWSSFHSSDVHTRRQEDRKPQITYQKTNKTKKKNNNKQTQSKRTEPSYCTRYCFSCLSWTRAMWFFILAFVTKASGHPSTRHLKTKTGSSWKAARENMNSRLSRQKQQKVIAYLHGFSPLWLSSCLVSW